MPELKNAKHERFAQAIANGQPASQAYVTAGYSKNDGNASRLRGNDKIKARIEEILKGGAKLAAISRVDVLRMLFEDRAQAKELEQMGAAIKAAELIGKDLGMFQETKSGNTIADLVDLFRAVADRTNQAHLNGTLGQREAATLDLRPVDPIGLRPPDS